MTKPSETCTETSDDIKRSIDHTRKRMDHTLEEIADRFHPRHLVDEILDLFRSDNGPEKRRQYLTKAKVVGRGAINRAKEHPIPALLSGAAALWLLADTLTSDVDQVAAGMGEASEPWPTVAPWSEKHDWTASFVDEQTWTEKAQAALNELGATLKDTTVKAKDKMRHAASTVVALSGRQRRDIHAQWANLREHSGSFVNARTGQPYDESYGKELESLRACEFASSHDWSDEEQKNWSDKAEHLLEELCTTLSDSTRTARDHLSTIATKLNGFVGSTVGMASDYGHSLRGAGRLMSDTVRNEGHRVQKKLAEGYSSSRESLVEAMDTFPLACAGVCFGAGLIAGALVPTTELEKDNLGAASQKLEESVENVVREGVERTSDVAEAALSAAANELCNA